jgi:hypothetical protein
MIYSQIPSGPKTWEAAELGWDARICAACSCSVARCMPYKEGLFTEKPREGEQPNPPCTINPHLAYLGAAFVIVLVNPSLQSIWAAFPFCISPSRWAQSPYQASRSSFLVASRAFEKYFPYTHELCAATVSKLLHGMGIYCPTAGWKEGRTKMPIAGESNFLFPLRGTTLSCVS